MEVLGIIPARGGSKGIPRKNIIDLCGKPLMEYTFDAYHNSKLLSRIVVSTEDKEIGEFAISKGVEVIWRPEELAGDLSDTKDVLVQVLEYLKEKEGYVPDYTMILQTTSPLRTGEDIDNCISMITENDADAVVSVEKVPHNCYPEKVMILEDGYLGFLPEGSENNTTRQLLKRELYARNGAAVYLFKTDMFLKTRSYYGDKCLPYIMSSNNSLDIDTYEDLELVEALMNYRKK